ncbi:MAG: ABC transporter permease [Verrucomicrobia bacterium]|nr:ABC transporter permease [Verrucomicrobiota bacterium]
MNFILSMAWRDSRASRRRLVLVSLSVVLGIAALVGIASLGENLKRAVDTQTKSLLGADLTITARQRLPAETMTHLRSLGGEIARETSVPSMVSFPTRGNARWRGQIRALDGRFPFYGELVTAPDGALKKLATGDFAVVEDTLLAQFGVQVGDEIKLGRATFKIAGALKKIPGEAPMVALMQPRIYVSMAALDATELLKVDRFARHRVHLKLPDTANAALIARQLDEKFRGQRLQFDTVESRKQQLGDTLKDVFSFMSLVGFVALFLGAVGVASAMHVYVRQKIQTVATLRCLGVTARAGFSIYLTQGCAVGLVGAVAGAIVGLLVQLLLPVVLKDFLPFQVDFFIAWPAVGKGMVAGLVICVLFTLLPLLAVRNVPPLLAIRSTQGDEKTREDPFRLALFGLIGAAVLGFAILQTGHWRTGAGFTAAMAAGFAVLAGVAAAIAWAAKRFTPRAGLPYVWRQGLANLHRPNNRTILLLLSLGLGTFLMLTLVLTRATLLHKIEAIGGPSRPNLMFFDIQEDEIGKLNAVAQAQRAPVVAQAPIVTMRIAALKGQPVEELLKGDRGGIPAWTLTREYRSTFRSTLANTERVTAGTFVPRVKPGEPRVPISMEEGLARDLRLKLGDELTFDVQGVPLIARVASLRKVEWQRLSPNFFVVFPEGVLEPAPKTFIAAVRVEKAADSGRVQQAVAKELPSVSAVDLSLILQTFDGLFAKVAWAISFLALFTVVTGVVVLVGAILTGRLQRIRETVLLRTLGATRSQLQNILLIEYTVLGVLAAVTGGVLAVAANALLARFLFRADAVVPPAVLLASIGGAVLVTLITGLVTNRGVAGTPPLEVLRQET